MARNKMVYDVSCVVHRLTYKAALLSPESDRFCETKSWFPLSEIEFERYSEDHNEMIDQTMTVTIPEWLINEKGWEDYV